MQERVSKVLSMCIIYLSLARVARVSFVLIAALLIGSQALCSEPAGFAGSVSAQPADRETALEFLLEVQHGDSTYCTASLLRLNSKWVDSGPSCRMVTNAHCFLNSASDRTVLKLLNAAPAGEFSGFFARVDPSVKNSAQEIQTVLVKIDRTKDLAELEVSPEIQNRYCATLHPIDSLPATEQVVNRAIGVSTVSLGYHGQAPQVRFTRDLVWPANGLSHITRSATSLSGIDHLYRLAFLQIANGMSGGVTLNTSYEVVGINLQFVPQQNVTEVIPLSDVIAFLKQRESRDDRVSTEKQSQQKQNGGENGSAHGGEGAGQPAQSLLEGLREPTEGVWVDTSTGRRLLLAVGGNQIDGLDDLRKMAKSNLPRIYQDSVELQRTLPTVLERFAGHYVSDLTKFEINREKFLLVNHDVAVNWPVIRDGEAPFDITIQRLSQRRFKIELMRGSYSSEDPSDSAAARFFLRRQVAAVTMSFQAEISNDAKSIRLVSSSGQKLICVNQFFFKIICSSVDREKPEELSLSLSRVGEPSTLSFRYSMFAKLAVGESQVQTPVVLYQFGSLQRIERP